MKILTESAKDLINRLQEKLDRSGSLPLLSGGSETIIELATKGFMTHSPFGGYMANYCEECCKIKNIKDLEEDEIGALIC